MCQITFDDMMIEWNPWTWMHTMFEPAPLMIAEDPTKTARIMDYQERRAARVEGLLNAALKRRTEANRRINAGFGKLHAIPFGQPVHGPRDRNYREKAARQIDRGYQISKEAAAFEQKAHAAEKNRSISSDDPMAAEKLTKQLDTLQKAQETMKSINTYYRKHKTLEGCAGCVAVSDSYIKAAADNINGVHGVPFPAWCLSNNNAEIRRIKDRIEELKQRAEQEPREWSGNGWTAETDLDDNRIRIYFEGKPDDETRSILKGHGFKWSPKAGAWQRQITRAAVWSMDGIAEKLP